MTTEKRSNIYPPVSDQNQALGQERDRPSESEAPMGMAIDDSKAPNELSSAQERAKQRASEMKHEVTDTVREQTQKARRYTTRKANDAMDLARMKSMEIARRQKDRAADELDHFASAIRQSADELHQKGDDAIADYADIVGYKLQEASRYLIEHDVKDLMDSTTQYARRRPELFVGGMLVAGLALGRFLKSSHEKHDSYEEHAQDSGTPGEENPSDTPVDHVDRVDSAATIPPPAL